jgi:hypothetical protein
MRQIVYVGSSVTNASPALTDFVRRFKRSLRASTAALIIEWIEKDSSVSFPDFFSKDLNNVRQCDAMIAIVDEPSIGLGMEICEAMRMQKPLLCLHKKDIEVSRLLVCMPLREHYEMHAYISEEDAVRIAAEFVRTHALGAAPQLIPA